jgi:hypothetical protein
MQETTLRFATLLIPTLDLGFMELVTMKVKFVSIFAIVLVTLSGIPLISTGSTNYASARYAPANTQTQSNANDCDTGTNCGITSPQTQGDGTANSPVNTQISEFHEEQEGGVGEEPPTSPPQTVRLPTGRSCNFDGFFTRCEAIDTIYSTVTCASGLGAFACTLTLRPPNTGTVLASAFLRIFFGPG